MTAKATTRGCSLTARPWIHGCRMLPSINWTRSTIVSMITPLEMPPSATASMTATNPAIVAPMIGDVGAEERDHQDRADFGDAERQGAEGDHRRVDRGDRRLPDDVAGDDRPDPPADMVDEALASVEAGDDPPSTSSGPSLTKKNVTSRLRTTAVISPATVGSDADSPWRSTSTMLVTASAPACSSVAAVSAARRRCPRPSRSGSVGPRRSAPRSRTTGRRRR